ncbi:hypothetical protein VaNZ11_001813 [Volvox africanus]|uniref:Peroxisomal membrane protein PEX14 n=1 Tax=Volvox africanus TaxID=51714 RepID=A0ABQ5RS22_9CHLO|nr:hypothetical protein VaNZ11_001813 [Volvox africanus]
MEESTTQTPEVSGTSFLPAATSTPITAPAMATVMPVAASAPLSASEPVAAPAIREDQIQNAVGFLSHPQVRSSTNTASKRSFLERKGLTAAEIDEAFRRVPEAPPPSLPPAVASHPAAPAPAPQPVTYAPQAVTQSYAPATNPPGTQMVAVQPAGPTAQVPRVAQRYRWSQVVLGVGAVFTAGWAVHQFVVPHLWALVESWQTQRREAEEARHKELCAAVASLKGCQEELKTSTQALLDALTIMREQQQRSSTIDGIIPTRGAAGRPGAIPPSRDNYYQSINGRAENPYGGSGGNTSQMLGADNYAVLRAAAGYTNAYPPDPPLYTVSYNYSRDSGPATVGSTGGDGNGRNGGAMYGMSNTPYGAVRSVPANPYGGPGSGGSGQQQPQQENLPYRVTAPPSPAHSTHSTHSTQVGRQQQPAGGLGSPSGPYGSSDRLYEQAVPGGARQGTKTTGVAGTNSNAASGGGAPASADRRTVPPPPPEQPAYPESFLSLMEMVQQGITPPNVRTDINDAPPDPTRPLSEARLIAPVKPWERAAAAAGSGSGSGSGGSGPAAPGKASGTPYSWGMGSQMDPSLMANSESLSLPPMTYGMQSLMSTGGGAVGTSSSAGNGSGGSSTARISNGGGVGGGGLTVLPPVNPAWRPPPPPARTVAPSNPASPPSASPMTGQASGSSSTGEAAAHVAATGSATGGGGNAAPEVLEQVATLAGPPSPSPSQPAFAASATGLMNTADSSSGGLAGAAPAAAAFPSPFVPLPPPSPPPPSPVIIQPIEDAGEATQAAEVATPSQAAAPPTTRS